MTGHTEKFVKGLSKAITADIFSLKVKDPLPKTGFKKYVYCSLLAGLEKKHNLEPMAFNSKNYDEVILVSPIWFNKLPPAFNSFFKEHRIDCNITLIFSCFVAYNPLIQKINNEHLKGKGEITQCYTIYDQKPSSYIKTTQAIKKAFNQKIMKVDSNNIHLDLLYE